MVLGRHKMKKESFARKEVIFTCSSPDPLFVQEEAEFKYPRNVILGPDFEEEELWLRGRYTSVGVSI